jgi:hypothetical protein
MYLIPPDFDFSFCVGSTLNQIALGKYDVQFAFDSGAGIAVQSKATLICDGTTVAVWSEEEGWSSLAFQDLLNQSVESGEVIDERAFELHFTANFVLRLHDTSDQYESLRIHILGQPVLVI